LWAEYPDFWVLFCLESLMARGELRCRHLVRAVNSIRGWNGSNWKEEMHPETRKVWAGGIAAGLAAGFSASKSLGTVIYTPLNETVDAANPTVSIDFENDGGAPQSIDYDSTNGLTLQKQTEDTFPGYVSDPVNTNYVGAVPFGESIGSGDGFQTDSPAFLNDTTSNSDFVVSDPASVQYIGVEFGSPITGFDYGWIGFEVTDDSSLADLSGIVTGYAYDDSGAAIPAGAVPEPTSLALLAMGAAGLMAYRGRRPVVSR
jgi:hypothetical protein